MKLNKETRQLVKIGTILTDSSSAYMVCNLWEVNFGKGICVTLECLESKNKGQKIYGYPLSKLYGMEIKEG